MNLETSKFNDLVERRKEWVKSSKENNFDFSGVLSGLYNDPSHFLFEILQNAEDEKANKVRFDLTKDSLNIYHNGEDFDFEDIEGVTGIGFSKKKDDLNTIGKFGVGFKSVFAISKSPIIHSGVYHFKIDDFVVPSVINESNQNLDGTTITIPFNHEHKTKEEIFQHLRKKLINIGLKTLLFLNNIKEIEWHISPNESGHYLREQNVIKNIPLARRIEIISEKGSAEDFLIFRKPINGIDTVFDVEVAFKIGRDKTNKEIIIPESESNLVVFFPTEVPTSLNFLIQGPYKTTASRETIPFTDDDNKLILDETGRLLAESILYIKQLGLLDTNFLNILPIENRFSGNVVYKTLFNHVKETLGSDDALLPTQNKTFTSSRDAIIARSKDLIEILDEKDILLLFSKLNFLDTSITESNSRNLKLYLTNELKIKEVFFEDLAKLLNANFLESKSDKWMIDFYSRLLGHNALWREKTKVYQDGILRRKPIIRLENNVHVPPFDEKGNNQVFLPGDAKSHFHLVKRVFVENEDSLKFLQTIGLSEPDIFAEIQKHIIPKYMLDSPDVEFERYLEDFETILSANRNNPRRMEKVINELGESKVIYAENLISGVSAFLKPSQVYFRNGDLEQYFEGYSGAYFISEELFTKFKGDEFFVFLKKIGVDDKPRRIRSNDNLTPVERRALRMRCNDNSYTVTSQFYNDYELEGLVHFLTQDITLVRSLLLWNLLLKHNNPLSTTQFVKFFEGTYEWASSYIPGIVTFDSKFLKTLQSTEWLIDKNGNNRRPSEISYSDLADDYKKTRSLGIPVLVSILKFRNDVIDQLPEDEKERLLLTKDIPLESLRKMTEEYLRNKIESNKLTWSPLHLPEEVPINLETFVGDSSTYLNLEEQVPQISITDDLQNKPESVKETEEQKTSDQKSLLLSKDIGIWGEKYVLRSLKERFNSQGKISETSSGFRIDNGADSYEIIWLNSTGNVGIGCDFILSKDGIRQEYIEVKTKTGSEKDLIEITGTQWEFARLLFDKNEGEKYWIYVVQNAGKSDAKILKIQNPIDLWKKGKLYAHPIRFKL